MNPGAHLRFMEENGLLTWKVHAEVPPRNVPILAPCPRWGKPISK